MPSQSLLGRRLEVIGGGHILQWQFRPCPGYRHVKVLSMTCPSLCILLFCLLPGAATSSIPLLPTQHLTSTRLSTIVQSTFSSFEMQDTEYSANGLASTIRLMSLRSCLKPLPYHIQCGANPSPVNKAVIVFPLKSLTLFSQQRLLHPALLNPLERHESWLLFPPTLSIS